MLVTSHPHMTHSPGNLTLSYFVLVLVAGCLPPRGQTFTLHIVWQWLLGIGIGEWFGIPGSRHVYTLLPGRCHICVSPGAHSLGRPFLFVSTRQTWPTIYQTKYALEIHVATQHLAFCSCTPSAFLFNFFEDLCPQNDPLIATEKHSQFLVIKCGSEMNS